MMISRLLEKQNHIELRNTRQCFAAYSSHTVFLHKTSSNNVEAQVIIYLHRTSSIALYLEDVQGTTDLALSLYFTGNNTISIYIQPENFNVFSLRLNQHFIGKKISSTIKNKSFTVKQGKGDDRSFTSHHFNNYNTDIVKSCYIGSSTIDKSCYSHAHVMPTARDNYILHDHTAITQPESRLCIAPTLCVSAPNNKTFHGVRFLRDGYDSEKRFYLQARGLASTDLQSLYYTEVFEL